MAKMQSASYQRLLLEDIEKIAKEAGSLVRPYYENGVTQRLKAPKSVVTEADIEAEQYIRKSLLSRYPFAFYGEETQGIIKTIGTQWVVDPLDGSENLIGYPPMIGVSIGLLHNSEPVVGVIYDVIHDVMYSAKKGTGASMNGKSIHVNETTDPKLAKVSIDFSSRITDWEPIIKNFTLIVKEALTIKVFGAPVLSLAAIASGKLELYYKPFNKLPDLVAGVCIVREAGGLVIDYQGKNWTIDSEEIIAGTPAIVQSYLQYFSS